MGMILLFEKSQLAASEEVEQPADPLRDALFGTAIMPALIFLSDKRGDFKKILCLLKKLGYKKLAGQLHQV
jgi:hypothetical protein